MYNAAMQVLPPDEGIAVRPFAKAAPQLILAVLTIASMSVLAYFPAVDNSFISDDFTMLSFVRSLGVHPGGILLVPSEVFRAASYAYFGMCRALFGENPEPFYWMGIGMHALVSLLVGYLAFVCTRQRAAGWTAAIYFVAYERHQEGVMWISAINDTILTLNAVLFLLLWERSLSRPDQRWSYRAALIAFPLALFSKEAAVALVPAAFLLALLRGIPWREGFVKLAPFMVLTGAYGVFWLSQAQSNFFVTDGHYALGPHFFPVFARSLFRVLSPVALFLVPLLVASRREGARQLPDLFHARAAIFFAVMAAVTIVPYSFLTYLDHIPSRNTYLPSVGLAGLIGTLFAALYAQFDRPRFRFTCIALLAGIVAGNVAYIWLKKEPQFRERAAPTRELLDALNSPAFAEAPTPIVVCGFPLHVSIGREAVEGFTRFRDGQVAFVKECSGAGMNNALVWEAESETYLPPVLSSGVPQ